MSLITHPASPSRVDLATTFAFVALALLAVTSPSLAVDPVKVGPEIVVSNDYAGYVPRVACDPAGNFIVVWQDEYSMVQARRWFATGNEFVPQFRMSGDNHYLGTSGSTSTGNLGVAGDAAGNFVVTYNAVDYRYTYSGYGYPPCSEAPCLFTRRNDANGVNGSVFTVQNPTQTYLYKQFYEDQVSNPEIAALGNGDFVVAWEGYGRFEHAGRPGSFGTDEDTFAARTISTGQRKQSRFRVNTFTRGYQGQYGDLSTAGDDDGNFVVVFRSEYYEYYPSGGAFPGGNIRGQLYDDEGKRVGTEFGLSSDDDTWGHEPDVARAPDGTFMVVWTDGDVTGRIFNGDGTPVTSDFAVGLGEYPAIAASHDSFVVVWRGWPDVRGQRFDLAGNELSSEFVANTTPYGYAGDVAASANGDFVAVWKNRYGDTRAQQFQVEIPLEQEIGVFGRRLVITNTLPDDPEKNSVKWKASGPEVVAPPRGTASDPRCNGDPPGTVKATVEFASPTSSHSSGVIDLPCQNWLAFGGNHVDQVATRSYRYHDGQLDDGPCNWVYVFGSKSITVNCRGSGNATDFPYDLEVGTGEGTVHAILDLGLYKFCASFPPSGGADGGDGEKFKGANAPIGSCP